MDKSKYVLWLPAWFPSKIDPLNGDFIQRHAEATALFKNIVVINIIKDPTINKHEKKVQQIKNIKVIEVYYPAISRLGILEKIHSFIQYLWYCFKVTSNEIKENGKPELIHVHVFQKSLIAGWFLSRWLKIPLILSEHNSQFLCEGENNFHNKSFLKKRFIKFLLSKVDKTTAVSAVLAKGMGVFTPKESISIIPNVVDTRLFKLYTKEKTNEPFRVIHISTLTPNKNIKLIIDAVSLANSSNAGQFKLTVIGPKNNHIKEKDVLFFDEMPQADLAEQMADNHALILFSNYETFGCVTIESLACGIPVILSNIPIAHNLIVNGKHGFISDEISSKSLANTLIKMKKQYGLFDRNQINKYAVDKFSYEVVGKQFSDLYDQLITP